MDRTHVWRAGAGRVHAAAGSDADVIVTTQAEALTHAAQAINATYGLAIP